MNTHDTRKDTTPVAAANQQQQQVKAVSRVQQPEVETDSTTVLHGNNPQVQQLKAYHHLANQSLQVKQLQAYQSMANQRSAAVFGKPPAKNKPQTGSVQRKVPAHTAVVQREKESGKESAKETGDLDLLLAQLKQLAQHQLKLAPGSDLLDRLNLVIQQLEEINAGSDTELKISLAEELKENLDESLAGLLKDPGESPSQKKGVVQGMWAIDYLLSFISTNPMLSIGGGLTGLILIIERVFAYKKKKTLPAKVSANLFANRRQEYWYLVDRKLNEFCLVNDINTADKGLLRTAIANAVGISHSEGNFLANRLPSAIENLGGLTTPNIRRILGNWGANFVKALDHDVTAIVAKSINTVAVPPDQAAGFSNALKRMVFVRQLYLGNVQMNMNRSEKNFKKKVTGLGNWKDKGSILNGIKEVDDGIAYVSKDRSDIDNGIFREKANSAERFIRMMVEADVLKRVPRPEIHVHLRNRMAPHRLWGFRAFHNGNEVHVAQDTNITTIVHEIGHHIEDHLPMLSWADIQLLLQGRNLDKEKAAYIYPHSYGEQRFSGDYPATGKYTSKYYPGGATEMMSMSSEYLSDPVKFKILIEKDPQQAALILRLLRPSDFATTPELKPFLKYLPA